MKEFLIELYSSSGIPVLSAFLLGLLTAISPCPLATNITAIAYLSKDIQSRMRVFVNGLVYTLGRIISYTSIGLLFYFGAVQMHFEKYILIWGEKIVAPLLIVIGLLMLDLIPISFPGLGKLSEKLGNSGRHGFWQVLLLGILLALAFCPYSGVLYFGMLLPLTISSPSGYYLPVVFAIATALPVIIFSWIIAFSLHQTGMLFNRLKLFEKWLRKFIAAVFILAGLYLIYLQYFA